MSACPDHVCISDGPHTSFHPVQLLYQQQPSEWISDVTNRKDDAVSMVTVLVIENRAII